MAELDENWHLLRWLVGEQRLVSGGGGGEESVVDSLTATFRQGSVREKAYQVQHLRMFGIYLFGLFIFSLYLFICIIRWNIPCLGVLFKDVFYKYLIYK